MVLFPQGGRQQAAQERPLGWAAWSFCEAALLAVGAAHATKRRHHGERFMFVLC